MSLIKHYIKLFKTQGYQVDILYIDKYLITEELEVDNLYKYEMKLDRSWSKFKKLRKILPFRKRFREVYNANDYDYVVVWRTETGLFLLDILLLKNIKYLLNIRDYFFESNKIIYLLNKLLMQRSTHTTISSKGFLDFLPKKPTHFLHSFNKDILTDLTPKTRMKDKGEIINIIFIGYVRFLEEDKKLINEFANDSRFHLSFIGEGSQLLKEYVDKINAENVSLVGSFNLEETSYYLEQADIINNLYGYTSIALKTAISTRYYYSLYLNIPILVYQDTYMDTITNKTNAFKVNHNYSGITDELYEWYHGVEFKNLKNLCSKEIEIIENENIKYNDALLNKLSIR